MKLINKLVFHTLFFLALLILLFLNFDFFINLAISYNSNPEVKLALITLSSDYEILYNSIYNSINKDNILIYGFTIILIFWGGLLFLVSEYEFFKTNKHNLEFLEKYESIIQDLHIEKRKIQSNIDANEIELKALKECNEGFKEKQKDLDKYKAFYNNITVNYGGNFIDFFNEFTVKVLGKEISQEKIVPERDTHIDDLASNLDEDIPEDFGIDTSELDDQIEDFDSILNDEVQDFEINLEEPTSADEQEFLNILNKK